MKIIIALVIGLLFASPALAGDWSVGGNTAWVGRSDVNVQVTLTNAATAGGACAGSQVAPPTQMIGPFAAGELRAISSAVFNGTGQAVCAHAFAYTGTGNTATAVGPTRSVEVTDAQTFPLDLSSKPPSLSHAP